jgi:flagellar hook-basal body complex protein FliE
VNILNATQAIGDVVQLARTNTAHLPSTTQAPSPTDVGSFEGLLMRALNGVNDLSIEADSLGQQMIVNPDSVDTHDVTIAMAQANLAISLTKAVVDGALQAYSGIINMR